MTSISWISCCKPPLCPPVSMRLWVTHKLGQFESSGAIISGPPRRYCPPCSVAALWIQGITVIVVRCSPRYWHLGGTRRISLGNQHHLFALTLNCCEMRVQRLDTSWTTSTILLRAVCSQSQAQNYDLYSVKVYHKNCNVHFLAPGSRASLSKKFAPQKIVAKRAER